MDDPGLDRHEWESEMAALEDELRESPAEALPELDARSPACSRRAGYDLDDPVVREGDEREVVAEYLAAHEITQARRARCGRHLARRRRRRDQRLPRALRLPRRRTRLDRRRRRRSLRLERTPRPMEAPPYSAAAVDVVRLPGGAHASATTSPSRSRSRSASAAGRSR